MPEFKINIVADASSAVSESRATAESLREVANATNESSKAAEKATKETENHGKSFLHAESQGRVFHKLLHSITEISPTMGLAMRLALSPITALMVGVVMAFEHVRKKIEESKKEAEEAGNVFAQNYVEGVKEAAEAIAKARADATGFMEQMKQAAEASQKSIKTTADELAKSIEAEKDALIRLTKAKEQYELSQATDEETKAAIRARYGEESQGLKEEALGAQLQAKQDELATREAAAPGLLQAVSDAEEESIGSKAVARRADIPFRERNIKDLPNRIAKLEKQLAGAEPGSKKWYQIGQELAVEKNALAEDTAIVEQKRAAQADAEQRTAAARQKFKQNEEAIAGLRREIPERAQQLELERAAGGVESAYTGKLAYKASIDQVGKDATAAAGRGDIPQFAAALMAIGYWPMKLAQLSDGIIRATEALDQTIKNVADRNAELEKEMQQINQRAVGARAR